jgi:hypothetical protein
LLAPLTVRGGANDPLDVRRRLGKVYREQRCVVQQGRIDLHAVAHQVQQRDHIALRHENHRFSISTKSCSFC